MPLFDVYPLFDVTPVRGQGVYVYDDQGQRYLDFYGGHAVISIGHAHPQYVQRLSEQVQRLGFYSNSVHHPLQREVAQKLGKLSGCEDYQLFLCNSGAEAVENALKMASFETGKRKVIAFRHGFHGRTSAAVNVTDKPSIQAPINQTFPTEFHPLNEWSGVAESLSKGDVCAVIIEGIQGIGGVHVPDPSFLVELARLCKQHGAVLILDEIQSGFGRSGRFFAYQYAPIEPDIITMAKGMGNGFPVGGVLLHPRFRAKHGMLGSTFGGNHLACAAVLAVLDILAAEDLLNNARTQGDYLQSSLRNIHQVKAVRGRGLMIGLEMDHPVAELRKWLLYQEHTFTGSAADPNVLRLLPPLTITPPDIDAFLQSFTHAMDTMYLDEAQKLTV
ncbi:MAG: aminotransferase class III-fold pyridoxal phosphate-dependent enzyme [Bacteroidota bacterium]